MPLNHPPPQDQNQRTEDLTPSATLAHSVHTPIGGVVDPSRGERLPSLTLPCLCSRDVVATAHCVQAATMASQQSWRRSSLSLYQSELGLLRRHSIGRQGVKCAVQFQKHRSKRPQCQHFLRNSLHRNLLAGFTRSGSTGDNYCVGEGNPAHSVFHLVS